MIKCYEENPVDYYKIPEEEEPSTDSARFKKYAYF